MHVDSGHITLQPEVGIPEQSMASTELASIRMAAAISIKFFTFIVAVVGS